MSGTWSRRRGPVVLVTAAALALGAAPAVAASSPPGGGAGEESDAGTTFLTAAQVEPGTKVRTKSQTGEYLYWKYVADSGTDVTVQATVSLPVTNRTGASTWRVDVFDGLRRRQACAAGYPTRVAQPQDTTVTLTCRTRTVRAWAEPWSSDPLPGTYYVRVATTDGPAVDNGRRMTVELEVRAKDAYDPSGAVDDDLRAPLVPITNGGQVLQPGATAPTRDVALPGDDDDGFLDGGWLDWLDRPGGRWFWTALGAAAAVLTGLAGFTLTRVRRRWFGFLR